MMVLALGPGAALALMCSGPGAKPLPLARMKWIPQRPPWWIPRGGLLGIPWWTTPGTRQGTPRGRPLRRYRIPGPARGAAPRALGSEQSDQPHPAEQCSIQDSTARTHQRGQNVQSKTKLWVGMELSALRVSMEPSGEGVGGGVRSQLRNDRNSASCHPIWLEPVRI